MEHGAAEPKGLKTLDNPPDSSQDMVFLKHVVFPLQPFDPALDEDVFQLDCRLYLLQHLHCTLCTGQLSAVNSCVFIHSPCVPNRVSGHLVAVGVEMTSEDRVTSQTSPPYFNSVPTAVAHSQLILWPPPQPILPLPR